MEFAIKLYDEKYRSTFDLIQIALHCSSLLLKCFAVYHYIYYCITGQELELWTNAICGEAGRPETLRSDKVVTLIQLEKFLGVSFSISRNKTFQFDVVNSVGEITVGQF